MITVDDVKAVLMKDGYLRHLPVPGEAKKPNQASDGAVTERTDTKKVARMKSPRARLDKSASKLPEQGKVSSEEERATKLFSTIVAYLTLPEKT